jgi:type 1 fimbria pilin
LVSPEVPGLCTKLAGGFAKFYFSYRLDLVMKQSLFALPLGMLFAMAATSASATTGTINFEGMITDITCPIEIINPETGAPGNLVRLGRVASSQFTTIGAEAGHRDFAMRVTPGAGCTSPTSATVKFTGVYGATGAGNTLHALRSGGGYSTALSNSDDDQRSATLALGYQAPFGSVGGGYTQGNGYRSLSLNASGALLLHGDGLEWGPYLGETMGLVEVPDTPGVGVLNATGVRTNAQGYALAPHLRPYRQNQVVLQTDQLDPEVEIDNGVTHVVPRRGAVVKAAFTARKVNRLVLTSHTPEGQPVPFGAQVSDARGERLGMVGQAGQVLLTTTAEPQTLDVRWGKEAGQHCQLQIAPQSMEQAQGYRLQTLTCTEPTTH